jgi:excisionase family DNA binding protein
MAGLNGGQPGVPNERRLFSIHDVAKACSVSTRIVYRWINDDHLPVHRIPGSGARGILRIDREDLDCWLRKYRHDFAEDDNIPPQTMTLYGRRFIKVPPAEGSKRRRR